MNKEAKAIWAAPEGGSLMKAMMAGNKNLTPEQQATLAKLKNVDPPNLKASK